VWECGSVGVRGCGGVGMFIFIDDVGCDTHTLIRTHTDTHTRTHIHTPGCQRSVVWAGYVCVYVCVCVCIVASVCGCVCAVMGMCMGVVGVGVWGCGCSSVVLGVTLTY